VDGFPSIIFWDGYPYYAQAILYEGIPKYGNPADLKEEICTFETLISPIQKGESKLILC
jgi:hypothetical protein